MREAHVTAVHALTEAHALPRQRVHIAQGATRELLVGLTDLLRADVLVMGAVSRRAVKRWFLGSTAEDVLDKVRCDLLIVKLA